MAPGAAATLHSLPQRWWQVATTMLTTCLAHQQARCRTRALRQRERQKMTGRQGTRPARATLRPCSNIQQGHRQEVHRLKAGMAPICRKSGDCEDSEHSRHTHASGAPPAAPSSPLRRRTQWVQAAATSSLFEHACSGRRETCLQMTARRRGPFQRGRTARLSVQTCGRPPRRSQCPCTSSVIQRLPVRAAAQGGGGCASEAAPGCAGGGWVVHAALVGAAVSTVCAQRGWQGCRQCGAHLFNAR